MNGSPRRKYALDTNLFIDALRDRATNAKLIEFHSAFAPLEYLHSVVVQELRAGVKDRGGLRSLFFCKCFGRVLQDTETISTELIDVLVEVLQVHVIDGLHGLSDMLQIFFKQIDKFLQREIRKVFLKGDLPFHHDAVVVRREKYKADRGIVLHKSTDPIHHGIGER